MKVLDFGQTQNVAVTVLVCFVGGFVGMRVGQGMAVG